MFAITGDKKPVFTGVVEPTASAWDRTKLTLAAGVHLCFQVLHFTYLHLYGIHK